MEELMMAAFEDELEKIALNRAAIEALKPGASAAVKQVAKNSRTGMPTALREPIDKMISLNAESPGTYRGGVLANAYKEQAPGKMKNWLRHGNPFGG